MKKILFLMLLLVPVVCSASSSVVMDMNAKRVLYCDNCNDVGLIASITKIMTTRR